MKTVDMKTRIHWFLWRRIGYLLLFVSVIFVINQLQISTVLNRQEVGKLIVGSLRDTHRMIVGKKTSKWNQPQHSKLVRDKNGRTVSLRGTRDQDIVQYLPNASGKFVCILTREEIDFVKINDDYCDCPDGSDEPGTNACNNGVFYCEMNSRKSAAKIPSYKVNDGFCDCCDGSDEWAEALVLYEVKESGSVSFHGIKCPNKC